MKVKMNGYNIQASSECISELLLAIGFAIDHCEQNNLPTLGSNFFKMHTDLYTALIDCGYYRKNVI